MRNILAIFLLLIATVTAALGAGYRNVMSVEAKRIIEQKKNVYLLDVRTPEEFRQARMKGGMLIPLSEIERRLVEVPKNRPILVYCAVGSRSNLVAKYLVNRGYGEVYNMVDGLVGWYRNGYPIER
ncbi:MAG: rhodanese-like domain-containing protein [Geobacter sp.]|nr:rhodanese-like domain-containing protein [Geobacter sp.]